MVRPAELAPTLEALAGMPAWLREHVARLPEEQTRRKPRAGGFSLVENVWHLADFEREGFGIRIRRVVGEDNPHLPDFDGEAVARERKYLERDPAEGLAGFESARAANLPRLPQPPPDKWSRNPTQDGYAVANPR